MTRVLQTSRYRVDPESWKNVRVPPQQAQLKRRSLTLMKNVSSIANAPKGGIGEVKNYKDAVTVCEVAMGLAQDDEDWDADC